MSAGHPTIETASQQIGIYSSRAYLPDQTPYVPLLYPFWGQESTDLDNPNSRRFDDFIEVASSLFNLNDLEQAQLAVLPFDWSKTEGSPETKTLAKALAQKAEQQGIPLAVFYLDDEIAPVELSNTLVFRTSGNRSTLQNNEQIIPAWSEDFVKCYCHGQVQVREKSDRPIVGYCGYKTIVDPKNQLTNQIRLQLGRSQLMTQAFSAVGIELVKHRLPWLYGSRIRAQAIFILEKSPAIQTNFQIQDRLHHTEALTVNQRQRFVENMLGSDYILCTRGGGNFSYRFYETLSCGRIPIFVNTDCQLPFERWIDWEQYCIWVEERDLPHIGKRIQEFHDRLTPQQFRELQLRCRQLWLDWLSPQGFFANFHRYFHD
jgi:Exostosin family